MKRMHSLFAAAVLALAACSSKGGGGDSDFDDSELEAPSSKSNEAPTASASIPPPTKDEKDLPKPPPPKAPPPSPVGDELDKTLGEELTAPNAAPKGKAPGQNLKMVHESSHMKGRISFFAKGSKGLDLSMLKWEEPAGRDNPGLKCAWKVRRKRATKNLSCLLKQKPERPVLVSLTDVGGFLSRVSVDAKGGATRARWIKQLKAAGFKPAGQAGGRSVFLSSDGSTQATLIWIPKKKAVSLLLKPGRA